MESVSESPSVTYNDQKPALDCSELGAVDTEPRRPHSRLARVPHGTARQVPILCFIVYGVETEKGRAAMGSSDERTNERASELVEEPSGGGDRDV